MQNLSLGTMNTTKFARKSNARKHNPLVELYVNREVLFRQFLLFRYAEGIVKF